MAAVAHLPSDDQPHDRHLHAVDRAVDQPVRRPSRPGRHPDDTVAHRRHPDDTVAHRRHPDDTVAHRRHPDDTVAHRRHPDDTVVLGVLVRQHPRYRRRRWAALIMLVVFVYGAWSLADRVAEYFVPAAGAAATQPEAVEPAEPVRYVVQPGDTLWTIAARLHDGDGDLRAVVDRLADANGGAALFVGQELVLDLEGG